MSHSNDCGTDPSVSFPALTRGLVNFKQHAVYTQVYQQLPWYQTISAHVSGATANVTCSLHGSGLINRVRVRVICAPLVECLSKHRSVLRVGQLSAMMHVFIES